MTNHQKFSPASRLMWIACLTAGLACGCKKEEGAPAAAAPAAKAAAPATSPHAASQPATEPAIPDAREARYLTNVTQLTSGFEKAGEGYFSKDMKWIIFQATPKGETQYQMYVA